MDARAAAMRAGHSALVKIRHVKGLGEFLVAVLAMKDVLRHGGTSRRHDSANHDRRANSGNLLACSPAMCTPGLDKDGWFIYFAMQSGILP